MQVAHSVLLNRTGLCLFRFAEQYIVNVGSSACAAGSLGHRMGSLQTNAIMVNEQTRHHARQITGLLCGGAVE